MNNRNKKLGYNAALEFTKQVNAALRPGHRRPGQVARSPKRGGLTRAVPFCGVV